MHGPRKLWTLVALALTLCLTLTPGVFAQANALADLEVDTSFLAFVPKIDAAAWTLRVSGPNGVVTHHFEGGDLPSLEVFDLVDGPYTWELRATPVLDEDARARLDKGLAEGNRPGLYRVASRMQSGYLTVADGAFLLPQGIEPANPKAPTQKDNVILDDLIVDGSACIGLDCANGESFGFDTLRLKENNLRIKFQDTSGTGAFPSNDWQITANESDNGGANKFSIDDLDGTATPFTIAAGAGSHALYVASNGQTGFGTSTPIVELHVVDGDTPTLRLEQNGSGGFTPTTWDVAGNDANFFVRDVGNGAKLPFRIRPAAPDDSLYVAADGDIGLGTDNPSARLDVTGSAEINGVASILDTNDAQASIPLTVQNSGIPSGRTIIKAVNQGQVKIGLVNTLQSNRTWNLDHRSGGQFAIDLLSNTGDELYIDQTGNVTALGTISGSSDVNRKHAFETVDPQEVLAAVAAMPITTWSYTDETTRHMGPMAQDFYAAFGLGTDERHISYTDTAGVTLAAIQALEQENSELKDRLAKLEALVERLAAGE